MAISDGLNACGEDVIAAEGYVVQVHTNKGDWIDYHNDGLEPRNATLDDARIELAEVDRWAADFRAKFPESVNASWAVNDTRIIFRAVLEEVPYEIRPRS